MLLIPNFSSLSLLLTGCSNNSIHFFKDNSLTFENNNEKDNDITIVINELPESRNIPEQYSNIENYYKYKVKNNKAVKYYNSNNVYILINKENYEISEFLYADSAIYNLGFETTSIELYDLTTEKMIAFDNGLGTYFNLDYYDSIRENNYQVCLNEIEDYIDGEELKEYYSLDEIRSLEPKILKGLKLINEENSNIKKRIL